MSKKTTIAIERLESALNTYDQCKGEHAETTSALKDAKEAVHVAARAVVDAEHGAVGLFDAAEEEAEAELFGR